MTIEHSDVMQSVPAVHFGIYLQPHTSIRRNGPCVHGDGTVHVSVGIHGLASLTTDVGFTGTPAQLREIVGALTSQIEEAEASIDARDRIAVFSESDQ